MDDVTTGVVLRRLGPPEPRRFFRPGVRTMPEEIVRVRPMLGIVFVGALAQLSDFATVHKRLSDIDSSLRPDGGPWPERPPPGLVVRDEDGFRSLPARVEMYRAALALTQGEPAATATHARAALAPAVPDDDLARAAAGALAGLALWAGGDLAGAHAAYAESVAGLTGVGHLADVLGCTVTLGDIRRTQGRLRDTLHTTDAVRRVSREALTRTSPCQRGGRGTPHRAERSR